MSTASLARILGFAPNKTIAVESAKQSGCATQPAPGYPQRLVEHLKKPKNFPALHSGWDLRDTSLMPPRIARALADEIAKTDDVPEQVELFTGRFEGKSLIALSVSWGRDDAELLVTNEQGDFLITGFFHANSTGVGETWNVD